MNDMLQNYLISFRNQQKEKMFSSCMDTMEVFCSSLDYQALFSGICDIIAVKHKSGQFKSSGFFVCFGTHRVLNYNKCVQISVNGILINSLKFDVDAHGYVHPYYPTRQQLNQMNLQWGRNQIAFKLQQAILKAEIHLFADNDKILVSDVDGTLTKSDVGGIINNFIGKQYLHEGYANLIERISKNGYRIVYLSMRSLPLYQMSKQYIKTHIQAPGALITQPEEFLPAIKKQVFKKTANIKANLIRNIKELFPKDSQPFVGGLGNRQNDSIAYLHSGVPLDSIFMVDTKSQVQQMSDTSKTLSYNYIRQNIDKYFPVYNAPKIGYKS